MPWNICVGPISHAPLLIFEGQMPKAPLFIPVCCRARHLKPSCRAGGTGGNPPVEATAAFRVRAQNMCWHQGLGDFLPAKAVKLCVAFNGKGHRSLHGWENFQRFRSLVNPHKTVNDCLVIKLFYIYLKYFRRRRRRRLSHVASITTAVAWLALGIGGVSRKRRGSWRFLASVQHLHRSFPSIWHDAAM